ncbi:hypothetical protein [Thiohalophilus sp.]|uniref:hypothetical protein n=1 Tax=Thiohalophilus sp. TaxID=3028392 RepID=UPI002ACED108|nr:hypothetical protein [Thiohalophilus sp.]MDZ7804425.1 hypothetical protein [Thiohalophilus sp.]
MGQVTIYLDDDNERRLKSAAEAAGMPVSRWVASLIQEKTRTHWPESVKQLAGSWTDFPDLEELRNPRIPDTRRESL